MSPKQDPLSHEGVLTPFRLAVLRGLGVVLPPLLTIVIFLWIGGTVQQYLLEPVLGGAERLLVATWIKADIRTDDDFPSELRGRSTQTLDGVTYQRLDNGSYVPKQILDVVREQSSEDTFPRTGLSVYRTYVRVRYLQPHVVIPFFLAVFTLALYLLGKFMGARIGRFFWGMFEGGILRLPLVRNVYSSVKQVSGFILNDRDLQVSRVVAVEYPRKGCYQIGFVMGEGMLDVEHHTGEPCVTVLICTSPMPMAGFAVNVRRSEVIDLNITLDQAIQFIVSCGVVVPRPRDSNGKSRGIASIAPALPSEEP